eukprot:CAMPEP_0203807608 /NCGR_PEP_ID=MMETSP0115-20131106/1163_1 /ASSEMBLY_ACC=CAM_ASM_000227 /TAXON_ID=33651 /ORGANISM="Bicosoecid sp, Strain ms1" /LENGTH=1421 /DNA_ID=CAMNT_0050716291 /DNA_START=31 /DNA_END=4293 /DNA_ORIENTATION=+
MAAVGVMKSSRRGASRAERGALTPAMIRRRLRLLDRETDAALRETPHPAPTRPLVARGGRYARATSDVDGVGVVDRILSRARTSASGTADDRHPRRRDGADDAHSGPRPGRPRAAPSAPAVGSAAAVTPATGRGAHPGLPVATERSGRSGRLPAGARFIARMLLPWLAVEDAFAAARVNKGWVAALGEAGVIRQLIMQYASVGEPEPPRGASPASLLMLLKELAASRDKWDPERRAALQGSFNINVSVRFRPPTAGEEERKLVVQLAEAAVLARGGAGGDGSGGARRRPRTPRGTRSVTIAPAFGRGGAGRGGAGRGAGASKVARGGAGGEDEEDREARQKELLKRPSILTTAPAEQVMMVPGIGPRLFRLPLAGESQVDVFNNVALPIVRRLMRGVSGAIMAYGQTGSGKTHALMGAPGAVDADSGSVVAGDAGGAAAFHGTELGLVPRVCAEVFERARRDRTCRTSIEVQFVEIYNERAYNLLDTGRETGLSHTGAKRLKSGKITASVYTLAAPKVAVSRLSQCLDVMRRGLAQRTSHSTKMNERSSRSHAVFIIHVTQSQYESVDDDTLTDNILYSTLHLVDLAGSERVRTSGTEGKQFEELKAINSSLTCLGRCITALAAKDRHVPYGDSVLTRLLQPALGGNCLTSLVVTASSDLTHGAETLSTLRFGERAATVTTHVEIERQSAAKTIKNLEKEVAEVRRLMDNMIVDGHAGTELFRRHEHRLRILTGQLRQLADFRAASGAAVDESINVDGVTVGRVQGEHAPHRMSLSKVANLFHYVQITGPQPAALWQSNNGETRAPTPVRQDDDNTSRQQNDAPRAMQWQLPRAVVVRQSPVPSLERTSLPFSSDPPILAVAELSIADTGESNNKTAQKQASGLLRGAHHGDADVHDDMHGHQNQRRLQRARGADDAADGTAPQPRTHAARLQPQCQNDDALKGDDDARDGHHVREVDVEALHVLKRRDRPIPALRVDERVPDPREERQHFADLRVQLHDQATLRCEQELGGLGVLADARDHSGLAPNAAVVVEAAAVQAAVVLDGAQERRHHVAPPRLLLLAPARADPQRGRFGASVPAPRQAAGAENELHAEPQGERRGHDVEALDDADECALEDEIHQHDAEGDGVGKRVGRDLAVRTQAVAVQQDADERADAGHRDLHADDDVGQRVVRQLAADRALDDGGGDRLHHSSRRHQDQHTDGQREEGPHRRVPLDERAVAAQRIPAAPLRHLAQVRGRQRHDALRLAHPTTDRVPQSCVHLHGLAHLLPPTRAARGGLRRRRLATFHVPRRRAPRGRCHRRPGAPIDAVATRAAGGHRGAEHAGVANARRHAVASHRRAVLAQVKRHARHRRAVVAAAAVLAVTRRSIPVERLLRRHSGGCAILGGHRRARVAARGARGREMQRGGAATRAAGAPAGAAR